MLKLDQLSGTCWVSNRLGARVCIHFQDFVLDLQLDLQLFTLQSGRIGPFRIWRWHIFEKLLRQSSQMTVWKNSFSSRNGAAMALKTVPTAATSLPLCAVKALPFSPVAVSAGHAVAIRVVSPPRGCATEGWTVRTAVTRADAEGRIRLGARTRTNTSSGDGGTVYTIDFICSYLPWYVTLAPKSIFGNLRFFIYCRYVFWLS